MGVYIVENDLSINNNCLRNTKENEEAKRVMESIRIGETPRPQWEEFKELMIKSLG